MLVGLLCEFYLVVAATLALAYGSVNGINDMVLSVVTFAIINGILARHSIRTGLSVSLFSHIFLGHFGKWRSQIRIEVMSINPTKLSAVLSQRVAARRAFFNLLKPLDEVAQLVKFAMHSDAQLACLTHGGDWLYGPWLHGYANVIRVITTVSEQDRGL